MCVSKGARYRNNVFIGEKNETQIKEPFHTFSNFTEKYMRQELITPEYYYRSMHKLGKYLTVPL